MKDLKQILAVGSIAYDSLDTPKGNRERILGGSCTYFSVAASHYAKTSIIGVVGNDFDNKSWSLFKEYNIDTECVEIADGPTFSWGGKYNSDYSQRDTLFTNLGVFEHFKPKINTNLKNPILYLGNIQPSLQLDVIKKVENPAIIAADSMNLWIDLFPKQVWELISKVDIFMLNDEEARQLTDETNLEKISEKFLSLGPKIVIIKMGGQGSLLAFKDKKHYVSVVPNTEVYDPTGAGDSFAGGVIGYIAKYGLDNPVEAVVHGSAVASYTVSGFGLEQLLKLNQKELNHRINQVSFR